MRSSLTVRCLDRSVLSRMRMYSTKLLISRMMKFLPSGSLGHPSILQEAIEQLEQFVQLHEKL